MGGRNPPEKAYFRSTTVSAVREDWVVVCAVRYEPVSNLQFPANKRQNPNNREKYSS
jgi:hypothetical protein